MSASWHLTDGSIAGRIETRHPACVPKTLRLLRMQNAAMFSTTSEPWLILRCLLGGVHLHGQPFRAARAVGASGVVSRASDAPGLAGYWSWFQLGLLAAPAYLSGKVEKIITRPKDALTRQWQQWLWQLPWDGGKTTDLRCSGHSMGLRPPTRMQESLDQDLEILKFSQARS